MATQPLELLEKYFKLGTLRSGYFLSAVLVDTEANIPTSPPLALACSQLRSRMTELGIDFG